MWFYYLFSGFPLFLFSHLFVGYWNNSLGFHVNLFLVCLNISLYKKLLLWTLKYIGICDLSQSIGFNILPLWVKYINLTSISGSLPSPIFNIFALSNRCCYDFLFQSSNMIVKTHGKIICHIYPYFFFLHILLFFLKFLFKIPSCSLLSFPFCVKKPPFPFIKDRFISNKCS